MFLLLFFLRYGILTRKGQDRAVSGLVHSIVARFQRKSPIWEFCVEDWPNWFKVFFFYIKWAVGIQIAFIVFLYGRDWLLPEYKEKKRKKDSVLFSKRKRE